MGSVDSVVSVVDSVDSEGLVDVVGSVESEDVVGSVETEDVVGSVESVDVVVSALLSLVADFWSAGPLPKAVLRSNLLAWLQLRGSEV